MKNSIKKKTLLSLFLAFTFFFLHNASYAEEPNNILKTTESVYRIVTKTLEGEVYTGSAFLISKGENYSCLATNFHVVEDVNNSLYVMDHSGKLIDAKLIAYHDKKDIAVLKVSVCLEGDILVLNCDGAKRGGKVYTLGFPGAADDISNEIAFSVEDETIGDGIISSVREGVTLEGAGVTVVQVSAPINSGNSGGPLVNEDGEIIGINTYSSAREGTEGISWAIHISELINVLDNNNFFEYTIADSTGGTGLESTFSIIIYTAIAVLVLAIIILIVLIIVNKKDKNVFKAASKEKRYFESDYGLSPSNPIEVSSLETIRLYQKSLTTVQNCELTWFYDSKESNSTIIKYNIYVNESYFSCLFFYLGKKDSTYFPDYYKFDSLAFEAAKLGIDVHKLIKKQKKNKKKRIKIIITLVVLTVFFIGSIFALFFKEFYIYTYGKYKLEKGSYEIAASIFDDIKGYKDADTLKMKAYYKKGIVLYSSGKYDDAINMFSKCKEYIDSKVYLVKCFYYAALLYQYTDIAKSFSYCESFIEYFEYAKYTDKELNVSRIQNIVSEYFAPVIRKMEEYVSNSDYYNAIEFSYGLMASWINETDQLRYNYALLVSYKELCQGAVETYGKVEKNSETQKMIKEIVDVYYSLAKDVSDILIEKNYKNSSVLMSVMDSYFRRYG